MIDEKEIKDMSLRYMRGIVSVNEYYWNRSRKGAYQSCYGVTYSNLRDVYLKWIRVSKQSLRRTSQ